MYIFKYWSIRKGWWKNAYLTIKQLYPLQEKKKMGKKMKKKMKKKKKRGKKKKKKKKWYSEFMISHIPL